MTKNKVNWLTNISGLTTKTQVVCGLVGLGLSLGALTLGSKSSQVTIKTFNQESLNSAFKSNLFNPKGVGLRFFIPVIPAVAVSPFLAGAILGGGAASIIFGIGYEIGKSQSSSQTNQQDVENTNKRMDEMEGLIKKHENDIASLIDKLNERNSGLQAKQESYNNIARGFKTRKN